MIRRFVVTYAVSTAVLAALICAVTAVSASGQSWLVSSALRSAAPMASGSALLLALVLWAHPLQPDALRAEINAGSKRALALVAPGYGLSASVGLAVCFAVAKALGGQTFTGFRNGLSQLAWADLAVGLTATLFDTALILWLARRYGARLQSFPMSLPAKLIVVVTVTVPLRATVALIFASLLPA
jgi:hypothetical protein